jgi:hypothetical protein
VNGAVPASIAADELETSIVCDRVPMVAPPVPPVK